MQQSRDFNMKQSYIKKRNADRYSHRLLGDNEGQVWLIGRTEQVCVTLEGWLSAQVYVLTEVLPLLRSERALAPPQH